MSIELKAAAALAPFYELMEGLEDKGVIKASKKPKPSPANNGTFDKRGAPYVCFVCGYTHFDKEMPVHRCLKKAKEIPVCDRCFEKVVSDRMARIELGITLPKKKRK